MTHRSMESIAQRREYSRVYARLHRKETNKKYRLTLAGKAKNKVRQLKWRLNLKLQALTRYGGPRCVCCGEERIEYLNLDHINNNGSEEREEAGTVGGYGFYLWLKKKGWPSGYQVMCWACNVSKSTKQKCSAIHPLKLVWERTAMANMEEN